MQIQWSSVLWLQILFKSSISWHHHVVVFCSSDTCFTSNRPSSQVGSHGLNLSDEKSSVKICLGISFPLVRVKSIWSTSQKDIYLPVKAFIWFKTTPKKDCKTKMFHIFSACFLHLFFRFSLNCPNGKTETVSSSRPHISNVVLIVVCFSSIRSYQNSASLKVS